MVSREICVNGQPTDGRTDGRTDNQRPENMTFFAIILAEVDKIR